MNERRMNMSETITAAGMVSSSVKEFAQSSKKLSTVMFIIMLLQLFVAVIQLVVAFK
jgi:hypothetical protein